MEQNLDKHEHVVLSFIPAKMAAVIQVQTCISFGINNLMNKNMGKWGENIST